ncbi:MAG: hypothetical protein DI569_05470 [Sphingopyxis macrogoltabida]|uniref:Uncharacterized protein n=1 Tax=Sphingopyxis macrogoltabida TaxID=33050 RepID=A0A2W5L6J6_SPHMC|nr:MAG: hypothetical protein DI569_05470 [Sphingopyxis macrogoltabida]
MTPDDTIDIRARVRAHGIRQRTIARLSAPDDWQAELRGALVQARGRKPLFARDGDIRLFAESFAIFFTATMMFLI